MDNLFQRFAPVLASATEQDIRDDVTLGGALAIGRDGALQVSYAPFEHVVRTARVVIVGITPGATQAANALAEARRRILAGDDDADALAAAKVHASFSDKMRDHLVDMLDEVGLNARLGIPTCRRLWDSHSHLAHFTSALRYPVFVAGENYSGTPSMTRTPLLRRYLAECLAEEARMLPDALWIPCGRTVAQGVSWLVEQGLLARERVCLGLLHPSPASIERIQYFLGRGRARDRLSDRTNPDVIDAAKAAIIEKIAAWDPDAPPATPQAPSPAVSKAALVAVARTPAKSDRTRKTEPKKPSPLGLAIQAAINADPRFEQYQPDRLYQCTYRTRPGGTVFAFERVTQSEIKLWLPATPAVEAAITAQGIALPEVSVPYPDPSKPDRYGRLSTLAYVPELENIPLYPVKVSTAGQATTILSAL